MANNPEVYGYVKRADCENDYHPENLHLDFEDDIYGRYFVRSDNNKILEKSTDNMATTETVTTRPNKNIARGFHDKVNHIIYLVDCDYDTSSSYIWSVDLSDDSITEIKTHSSDVFDIWRYDSKTWVYYFDSTGFANEVQAVDPNGDGGTTEWETTGGNHFGEIDEGFGAEDEADFIHAEEAGLVDIIAFDTFDLDPYDSGNIYGINCRIFGKGGSVKVDGNLTGMIEQRLSFESDEYAYLTASFADLDLEEEDLNGLEITLTSDTVPITFIGDHNNYNQASVDAGLCWYNDHWYCLSADSKVYKMDVDWNYVDDFSIAQGGYDEGGICWDGSAFFICYFTGGGAARIVEYNTAFVEQNNWDIAVDAAPRNNHFYTGITWDGTYFYVTEFDNEYVYRYNTSWEYQTGWDVSAVGTGTGGIWWSGDYFYIVRQSGVNTNIYEYTDAFALNQTFEGVLPNASYSGAGGGNSYFAVMVFDGVSHRDWHFFSVTGVFVATMDCNVLFKGDTTATGITFDDLTGDNQYTDDLGAIAGKSWVSSQITIVGADFHYNFKWSNASVKHNRFQTGDDSFDELEDCGVTTELPPIQQHGISYDDDDILYFVLGTGTAEVSTIVAEAFADVNDGEYILYSAMEKNAVTGVYVEKDYYIWFDKAGDESGDPGPLDGQTEILVDINGLVTAQEVSDALEAAVNAITLITCDNAGGVTCTLTNHYNGNTTNIADGDTTWTVATTVPGVDNTYYLYTYGITDDALTQKGLYPIALMLNRNTDSTNTPEALALEKAFHLTEMRVYQISRAKGNLNIIANWLTSRSTNNTIVSITDSYVIINNDGTYECWEYIDVMDTLIVQSIINTEERMRPSCNILYLKKADYNDPPIEGQMYTIFGRYSSANLGNAFYMNYPDNFNLETAGAITVAGDMDWLDTLTLPDTCSATLGTLNGHKNVLGISHAGVDDPIAIHQFDAQLTSGAYEWWWASSDISQNQTIRFKGTTIAVYLRINGAKYTYLNLADAEIEIAGVTPTNNILDHFRLEFDCATDLFDLYINGTLRVDGGEFNNVDTYIDELYMASIADNVYTQYIDAPCDISHANCYAGKNRVQYNDDQVIFEGRIKDHNLDIVREMFALSQSIELKRIHPTITDYTNYTGKTTGPIITQLLSDFSNYVTSGTISAGSITWTCPADWEAQGDKNLLTIINELCDSEYFTWRLNPKGELDADDGSTESFIKFQSTDEYSNPEVEVLSQDINQVIVWGGLVGATQKGPFTADDEANQAITGGIITWSKRYAGVLNDTDLQTIADNKLLLQGASPLLFDCEKEYGGASEFGFVQCGETIYIDSNIRVSEGSDEYVTVGNYILYKNDFNAKEIDSEIRLTEGILWKDHNPTPTLDQQNNQMILQLANTLHSIVGGLVIYLQQDVSADIGGYLLMCTDVPDDIKTEVMNITVTATDQELEQWGTSIGCPGVTELLDGIYSLHAHTYKFSGTKDLRLYFKVYQRTHPAGAETLIATSETSGILGDAEGTIDLHAFGDAVALETTDRIVLKLFAKLEGVGSNPVIYFYVEGVTLVRLQVPIGLLEPVGAVGESNTASNVGVDGVGVFDAKVAVDLQFRNIAPASAKITVVENGNDIDLDVAPGEIAHNDLKDLNAGDVYEHISAAQLAALHAIYTDAAAVTAVATADDYIKNDAADTLGGDLSLGAYEILLNSNPADHTASGMKAVYTAGENLVFGNVVYMKTADGKMWKAQGDVEAECQVVAMALATIAADATGEFLLYGIAEDAHFAFTIGILLWVDDDTAGLITHTMPPDSADFVCCIGKCMDHATRILFNPQYEYFELS